LSVIKLTLWSLSPDQADATTCYRSSGSASFENFTNEIKK